LVPGVQGRQQIAAERVNAPSTLIASTASSGVRLDVYLARQMDGLTRTRARELILAGDVRVDGRPARPSQRIECGQSIAVAHRPPVPSRLTPEPMDLSIVYEDEDVLVVDKPPGLAIHPAPGHMEHTLVHGLLARNADLTGIGGVARPGIVHRLDLDTSGLVVVAKTERGHACLSAQFAERKVKKGYLALLSSGPAAAQALIDAPIGRDPRRRQQMAVVSRGRPAQTRYATLGKVDRFAFALAMPLTGRTHQIRVHFASIGCPIVGDAVYGGAGQVAARQFLHAALLRFARPSDGRAIELFSPLPPDLAAVLIAAMSPGTADHAAKRIAEMVELARNQFQHEAS
jgi:23S rRNA pseudouridine1911/1915/1917 synthase